ncbi:hypothetical protein CDAR_69731 [Caerostris darwini]|uniref:Uncharacterized protein n=1 Tax=Caerostris darwini TaxID=1538125 RepID=A0AAV4U0U2_9ARAC|nr:hypothetical protein CDAR_69731 [Caerostris darwini]
MGNYFPSNTRRNELLVNSRERKKKAFLIPKNYRSDINVTDVYFLEPNNEPLDVETLLQRRKLRKVQGCWSTIGVKARDCLEEIRYPVSNIRGIHPTVSTGPGAVTPSKVNSQVVNKVSRNLSSLSLNCNNLARQLQFFFARD